MNPIPKDQLEDGAYYIGKHRQTRIAMWCATGNVFYYIRRKFDMVFMDKAPYESDSFAVFVPFMKIHNVELLTERLFAAVDALRYYSHSGNIVKRVNTGELFELSQMMPHVVYDANLPGEEAQPKPFGHIAREALDKIFS